MAMHGGISKRNMNRLAGMPIAYLTLVSSIVPYYKLQHQHAHGDVNEDLPTPPQHNNMFSR